MLYSKIGNLQDNNQYRLNWAIKNNLKIPGKHKKSIIYSFFWLDNHKC